MNATPDTRATLCKAERLHGKTVVGTLMSKGRWGVEGHFKYCFLHRGSADGSDTSTDAGICRIITSVPKKHFKRAVKRNLLKRRTREAYRRQKSLVQGLGIDVLFSYASSEIATYEQIYEEVGRILKAIAGNKA